HEAHVDEARRAEHSTQREAGVVRRDDDGDGRERIPGLRGRHHFTERLNRFAAVLRGPHRHGFAPPPNEFLMQLAQHHPATAGVALASEARVHPLPETATAYYRGESAKPSTRFSERDRLCPSASCIPPTSISTARSSGSRTRRRRMSRQRCWLPPSTRTTRSLSCACGNEWRRCSSRA